jgi:alkylation response protein AidB-like acyl-CoA dehydrogenase
MTVRCFVSEAMVYRTLGDVDRALEAIDPADSAGALKAIEAYAVECSINKVATSEALAYAVDEAVQVFGGNGYSREFPVERGYRDARITRIYEGTNEINRLIIPTRLLKAAGPLLHDAAGRAPEASAATAGNSVLSAEHHALADVKRLALVALATASDACGAAVRDQQEVLAHIADVVIECYAVESALIRAEKIAARGSERAAIAADVARVYASDAMDRVAHAGKQIANALAAQATATEPLRTAVTRVREHPGIDTVGARRRIGDAAISRRRYPF